VQRHAIPNRRDDNIFNVIPAKAGTQLLITVPSGRSWAPACRLRQGFDGQVAGVTVDFGDRWWVWELRSTLRSVDLVSCEAEGLFCPQSQEEALAGSRQCLRIAGGKRGETHRCVPLA